VPRPLKARPETSLKKLTYLAHLYPLLIPRELKANSKPNTKVQYFKTQGK
jgi:hypothetical protein